MWTAAGENMENVGVKPDVYVDNGPEDLVKGRDAQIEKAVEVLKAEIAAGLVGFDAARAGRRPESFLTHPADVVE